METVNLKKQISFYKFQRIRANGESIPVRIFRQKMRKYEPEKALEAYLFQNYIYAIFKCKKQIGDRLTTHCIRYNVGDSVVADDIAWRISEFPKI